MSLKEAVAKYKEAVENLGMAEWQNASVEDRKRRRVALDAAVRDVALAAVDLAAGHYLTNGRARALAEIDQLFPEAPPHG